MDRRLHENYSTNIHVRAVLIFLLQFVIYTCSGVHVEGLEFYVGNCCHVRGAHGRDDEYTCEITELHEDNNGEMMAKVQWFYWPAEVHKKRKLKNLPLFSSKEVILSDEYDVIEVETLSKSCQVTLLPSNARIPNNAPKETLYCRWKITKGSKELLPSIPTTPLPVKKQKEENKQRENEVTSPKKRKTSPNVTKASKKKCKVTPTAKKQKMQPVNKAEVDKNLFQVARER